MAHAFVAKNEVLTIAILGCDTICAKLKRNMLAQQPKKQVKNSGNGSKALSQKPVLKVRIKRRMGALMVYFGKANGYEVFAMMLFAGVLLVICFAKPTDHQMPVALRLLGLITVMAAKFFSNSGLSSNPGSSQDQADSKKLSLILDAFAALLAGISFFV